MPSEPYVLVVEDDDEFREMLVDGLRLHGVKVVDVADGASALAYLDVGSHPTLIVSDVVMPGVLGSSVAAYVDGSVMHRDIPVVFITGTPELALEGHRVLVKPFHMRELLEVVRDAGIEMHPVT